MTNLRDRLPPANSIVAFEAAARLGSYSSAARELGVTPAAISRHIRLVDEYLGTPTFEVLGRGKSLTLQGRELFEAVSMSLEHIAGVGSKIRHRVTESSLKVATPLAFASMWLMPRLMSFRSLHPDIELRFITADTDLDPALEGISLAVRYGTGKWPHLDVTPLLNPQVFPVCSQEYLQGSRPLKTIDDLQNQTLLERISDGSFGVSWAAWLKAVEARPTKAPMYMFFNSYEVAIRAALAGQGIALGVDILVEDMLKQKLLVRPLDRSVAWKEGYFLVSPRGAGLTPEMEVFADWLTAQTASAR